MTMRVVVLDTETTGINFKGKVSDGHRIIEVACVEIVGREITGKEFHALVNPGIRVSKGATKVHGITDDKLKSKPKFQKISKKLLDFIGESDVIIHNAPFDIEFLDEEFKKLPKKYQPKRTFNFIDTLPIARSIFPGEDNTLDALARKFELTRENKRTHGALEDARLLAKIFLMIC